MRRPHWRDFWPEAPDSETFLYGFLATNRYWFYYMLQRSLALATIGVGIQILLLMSGFWFTGAWCYGYECHWYSTPTHP